MKTISGRIIKPAQLWRIMILQTLSSEQMEYAIRIGFKVTTNEVEYEALLDGLQVATEMGVDFLDAFSDS